MAKHDELTAWQAIHQFAYASNTDPSLDASISLTPYKGWIDTSASNTLKVRNAANGAWEDVSVAGAGTTPAFGSNSNSVSTSNSAGAGVLTARSTHQHIGVTSLAHTSNTFVGPVTLTAGANVGITSSASGTYRIDVNTAGGGGSSVPVATTAKVATAESTTSGSFADLATPGPSVTATVGASGKVKVTVSARVQHSVADTENYIGVNLSGANTVAASTIWLALPSIANKNLEFSRTTVLTGLAAGSTTFKMQYATAAATATFRVRELIIELVD